MKKLLNCTLIVFACTSLVHLASEFTPKQTFGEETLPFDLVFAQRTPNEATFEIPVTFAPGGNLILLKRNGSIENLTNLRGGDVQGPEVSYDGRRIIFSMKKGDRDFWHIYELSLAAKGKQLGQLTFGDHDDIDPCYLPDGSIVFCSDRAGYVDEYGRGPAFLLHTMKGNGSKVRQISFNFSHDFTPTVLKDGRLLFCRWLHIPGAHTFPLFTAKPDGASAFIYYGAHPPRTGLASGLFDARGMPDGSTRVIATAASRESVQRSGKIVVIDRRLGINKKSVAPNKRTPPNSETDGYYKTPYPLRNGQVLTSFSPHSEKSKSIDDRRADLDFGIYILEVDSSPNQDAEEILKVLDRKLLYNDPRFNDESPTPLILRDPPKVLAARRGGRAKAKKGAQPHDSSRVIGLDVYRNLPSKIHFRSGGELTVERGTIEKVRIIEGVGADAKTLATMKQSAAQTDKSPNANSTHAKGPPRQRILGAAPVYPDGSFCIELPPLTPFRFQTLDGNGAVVAEQMSWLYLMPGERRTCRGCHANRNETPSNIYPSAVRHSRALDEESSKWIAPRMKRADPSNCTDCHSSILDSQWKRNAHANSHKNPRLLDFYNGTDSKGNANVEPGYKLDFPKTDGVCAVCHAPLPALKAPWGTDFNELGKSSSPGNQKAAPSPATSNGTNGVHCVFCHRVSDVELNGLGTMPGVLSMKLRKRGKSGVDFFFGPYDDVHSGPAVYMPLHTTSEFCAPCHEAQFWGTQIYATFSEWRDSDYARGGIQCQDCHTRAGKGFSPPDPGRAHTLPMAIPQHVNRETEDVLLEKAAELDLHVQRKGERIVLEVTVKNVGAGHHLPTGHAMRNVLLVVSALDATGRRLEYLGSTVIPELGGKGPVEDGNYAGMPGKMFAKVLEDSDERSPAPAWRRTIILMDTRIPAGGKDSSLYEFKAPDAKAPQQKVTVKAKLIYRRFFKPIIDVKKWELRDEVMASKQVDVEYGGL